MPRSLSLLLPFLLALTPGCVSSRVQYADTREPSSTAIEDRQASGGEETVVGHLHADAWGIHLFSSVPLVTGGVDREGRPDRRWFEDSVRIATLLELLRTEARRRGATHLIDLQSTWKSNWVGPTLIFWTRETRASATALRVTGDPPHGAIPVGAAAGDAGT